jgi:hypothetical protein
MSFKRNPVQARPADEGGPPPLGLAIPARCTPRLARGVTAGLAVILIAVVVGCGADDSRSAAEQGGTVKPALEAVRSAFQVADPAPFLATLAEDVQLHSPALMSPPDYRGRNVVGPIVTLAMRVIENVRVTDFLESEDAKTGGAVFEARIGGVPAQRVVMLRAKDSGVSEITLLIRPLPALRAFVTRMGELGAQPALDAPKS